MSTNQKLRKLNWGLLHQCLAANLGIARESEASVFFRRPGGGYIALSKEALRDPSPPANTWRHIGAVLQHAMPYTWREAVDLMYRQLPEVANGSR